VLISETAQSVRVTARWKSRKSGSTERILRLSWLWEQRVGK
jgi:hypothetical protein